MFGGKMKVCFVDEAGDLGALSDPPRQNDQPVLVIGGLILNAGDLHDFTVRFLDLKAQYFPRLPYPSPRPLDRILPEIKGQDLRRNVTRGNARQHNHTIGFLDRILGLLKAHSVQLVARIWVKSLGGQFDATSVYTSSMQSICSHFNHYLTRTGDPGVCIADSRNNFKNVSVSHSIFTQKFGRVTRKYEGMAELPTFGHSDNHAGLQVCDLVCSGLLFPIACFAYCSGHVNNVHVQPRVAELRLRYGQQLKALQYRYYDETLSRYRGGFTVSDAIGHQSGSRMFI